MPKDAENGNFDRPCFVQTVYLIRTLILTQVASEGWKQARIQGWAKVWRLMSGCVHCDIRQRHYRLATSEKPGETGKTFSNSVCRELLVGQAATRRGERWA